MFSGNCPGRPERALHRKPEHSQLLWFVCDFTVTHIQTRFRSEKYHAMGIAGIGFLVAERRLLVTVVVATVVAVIAVVATAMIGLELDANGVGPALVPEVIGDISVRGVGITVDSNGKFRPGERRGGGIIIITNRHGLEG